MSPEGTIVPGELNKSYLNETCLGSNFSFYRNWHFTTIYALETYLYSQLSFPIEFIRDIFCELMILNVKFMMTAKSFQIDQSDHFLEPNSQSKDDFKKSN